MVQLVRYDEKRDDEVRGGEAEERARGAVNVYRVPVCDLVKPGQIVEHSVDLFIVYAAFAREKARVEYKIFGFSVKIKHRAHRVGVGKT